MACEQTRSGTVDAPPNAEPPTPELPMLPAAQVTAIIEQMRVEQAQLLQKQQDAIVAQVMRNLSERGVNQVASDLVGRRHGLSTLLSPSKLEQNLHSLVLHSLEESGLDYPHVQRTTGSSEQTLRSTRPSPSKSVCHRSGKTTVVSRHETNPPQEDTHLIDDVVEEAIVHGRSLHPTTQSMKKKSMTALITKSPLQGGMPGRDPRRNKPRSHRRQRHGSAGDGDLNDVDSEFDSAHKRVGYKTQAILDRSRALLDDMKKHQRASPGGSGGSNSSFVSRMRQTLAAPQDQEAMEGDQDGKDGSAHLSRSVSPTASASDEKSDATCTNNQADQHQTLRGTTTTQRPDSSLYPTAELSASCTDIEILNPPAHSPENENEWENELARQILTIYATSVKAKRATNRPSSHASSHGATSAPQDKYPRLGTSCSLPAISHASKRAPTAAPYWRDGARSRSPPRATVQYSWEPSQRLQDGRVVVNMPKVPKPIWFGGTGAVKAVWCAIAEAFQGLHASPTKANTSKDAAAVCVHQLCEEVRRLEAKQQYAQCITTLETLLVSLVRARGVDALDTKLWKQLVVTCNAFASRCVDYKKFAVALQLIKQAEHLLHNSILVDDAMRFELLAYLYDTYAHYYYRRGKSHAGLQYMFKAHEIHGRQSSWAHLAKCRLHIANLLSQQGKHQDAMGSMGSILEMIEDRKLEDAGGDGTGASAQKVCLAAVCYNNLAIEQLHLRAFEAATVSTGNAKRLAKLCLSYSNRWLAQFDATSNCVDLAIATLMEDVNAAANAPYKS